MGARNSLNTSRLNAVERLEDRDVPTVVFSPNFGAETVQGTNDGIQNPQVNIIFSGTYWTSTAQGKADEQALLASAQRIIGGPYLSDLTEYGASGTATFGRTWNDSSTVASQPSTGQLQTFLQTSIANNNAAPGFNNWQHAPIYVVVSDPNSSAQFNGGWNADGTYNAPFVFGLTLPQDAHMVWVGTSSTASGVVKDYFSLTLSHELAEAISDPDSNGITVTPPNASARAAGPSGVFQIGDGEPEAFGNKYGYRLNGDLVQPYWSRNFGGYVVPDGNSQTFTLTPLWTSSTSFSGQYDLAVTGDQLGVNYNDSISVSSSAASGTQATMNNQSVSFDQGKIRNVTVNPGGGYDTVHINSVVSGMTVNVVDYNSASFDDVIVGGGSMSNIQGTVNVSNSSGRTWLQVDAANDGARSVTVTSGAVDFQGVGGVNYTPTTGNGTGVMGVEIDMPYLAANQIDVLSAPGAMPISIEGSYLDHLYGPAAGQVGLNRLGYLQGL